MPKTLVNGEDGMEDDEDETSDSDEESEDGDSNIPNIQAILDSFLTCYLSLVSEVKRVLMVDILSQNFDIQVRRVAHHGCVNRIRAMPQKPQVCVSWADSGHVQVI